MYNVYMKYVLEAKKKDASASKGDLLKCHNYFTFTLATGHKMGVTKLR